jgi:hypothetical protein
MSDAVEGALPGMPKITLGTLNAIFDNTATSGLHVVASGAGVDRLVTVARGIRAAPAAGDPCFTCYAVQDNYLATEEGGAAFATIKFGQVAEDQVIAFAKAWGPLLHPKGTETAANTATGVDDLSVGTTSTNGGFFWWHLLSSDGTVTLKAQNAATNSDGSFSDITGATSGSITAAVSPKFGWSATAAGLTVTRYLRPQLALGTATTLVYVSGFVRG